MQANDLETIAEKLYLAIALTAACNFRCGYCHPFGESKVTHGKNLSESELKDIVDSAHDCGFRTFRFTGGECTILPWFGEVLEHTLQKEGVHVNLCTNGSTLAEHIDLLEKHKNQVSLRVSLDTTSEKDRKFGFYKVLTSELETTLEDISTRGIYTRFNTVVTQQNKSEVFKIIKFAQKLSFDVKLLDLYIQNKYIFTEGKPISSEEYWNNNYVNLRSFAKELEPIAQEKISSYNIDGGFGIPMYAFKIGNINVIFKDSTKGSFYHREKCIKKCELFANCQEGVYVPHVSSDATLHINGCYNPKLRWNLRNKTAMQRASSFYEILSLFSNLEHRTPTILSESLNTINATL